MISKIKNNMLFFNLYKNMNSVLYKLKKHTTNYNYRSKKNPSFTLSEIKEYNINRVLGPQEIICNAPFTSIFISITGDVSVCGYNKTYILGNIRDTPLTQIWLNDKHRKLQEYIKDYDLSHGCQHCILKIKNKDYHRAALYSDTPKHDHTQHLRKITFELSNLCNLECIMCNGELSSLIRKKKENREPLELVDKESLVNELIPFIPHLQTTQFLGGEPLLIKKYYEIWDKLIELNKQCIISIQTNGMVLPDKFTELIRKSRQQFMIGFSIDSFKKERFEAIRKNARFDVVMNNFNRLMEYKKDGNIQLSINFVPMNINWNEIPDALDFANKHDITLSLCELLFPYDMSFNCLSSVELKKIIAFLEKAEIRKYDSSRAIENILTYKNQIRLLKNTCRKMETAEHIYPLTFTDDDTFKSVIASFETENLDLFMHTETLRNLFKNNFLDKLQDMEKTRRYIMTQLFNRYIFFYREIFETEALHEDFSINDSTNNFLLFELRNAIHFIMEQGKNPEHIT